MDDILHVASCIMLKRMIEPKSAGTGNAVPFDKTEQRCGRKQGILDTNSLKQFQIYIKLSSLAKVE